MNGIVFILTILLTGAAWAWDDKPTCSFKNACYDCVTGKCVMIACKDILKGTSPCAEKMEQAMRAIEQFIPSPYWAGLGLPDNGGVQVTLMRERIPAFLAAITQWEQVKQECWQGENR